MKDRRLLTHLAPGHEGVIAGVDAPEGLRKRLAALGFRAGRTVRLVRQAALAGPLQVRLGSTDVALRPQEAEGIQLRAAVPATP